VFSQWANNCYYKKIFNLLLGIKIYFNHLIVSRTYHFLRFFFLFFHRRISVMALVIVKQIIILLFQTHLLAQRSLKLEIFIVQMLFRADLLINLKQETLSLLILFFNWRFSSRRSWWNLISHFHIVGVPAYDHHRKVVILFIRTWLLQNCALISIHFEGNFAFRLLIFFLTWLCLFLEFVAVIKERVWIVAIRIKYILLFCLCEVQYVI